MCRSSLEKSACILAIVALMLAPAALRAQSDRPAPATSRVASLWSELGQWAGDLWTRLTPWTQTPRVHAQAAPAGSGSSTSSAPDDWVCFDCAQAGPHIDPDG